VTIFRLLFNACALLAFTGFPVFTGFGLWIAFYRSEPWIGGLVMVVAGLCGASGLFFLNAARKEV
jgi:hypothetical protein